MAQYLIGNIKGPKGEDGISPRATVTQVEGGAVISITDATGTTSAEIRNGIDGSGEPIDLSNYATHDEVEAVEDKIRGYNYTPKSYVDSLVENIDIGVKTVNGKSGDVLISIPDVSEFATDAELAAVQNSIPNATSQLINDSNFVSTTDLENYATTSALEEGLAAKQDTLTAGANITIENNVISSTASGGTTYTAGAGIDITNDEISVDNTVALKSELFSGDYNDLTNKPTIPDISGLATTDALTTGLATKQDVLTAGTGIDITDNVISATGGGSGSYTWTDEVLEIENTLDATSLAPLIEKYQENKYYPVIHYGNLYYHFFCIYPLSSNEHLYYITLGLGYGGTGYQQWNMIDIQFNTSDKSFVKVTTPTNRMPTEARGLTVRKAYSVTGAEASAADNFKYILDNYAKTADLAAKQDALTAGDGITIENNVISASGGSSSINVDGVSIINDNGTYKTAIGGGTVVQPTVDYLVNGSGTTTQAIAPDSYISEQINFSTPLPVGTYDVTYTIVNHDDNDASTTITTTFESENNGNSLSCTSGGLGSLGFWIGDFWMTGSGSPYEGISSVAFSGTFTNGANVEITGCTISANGTNYLDNQTITFNNGAQPGSQSIVPLTSSIPFTQTLVGPGYDDNDLTINLSGTVTVKNRNDNDSVVATYSFTDEPYRIQSGGAPVFYYDGNDYSHDYILNMLLCSVSSRDQDTGAFNMTGIQGVQLQNGSPGSEYYAELTELAFSLGGSETQYINPDFLPLGDNLYVQDGRVHANGAPMYDGHLVIYDTDHNNGWYLTTDGNTITLNPCPWNN